MKAKEKFVELDSMYLGLIAYIKKVSNSYIENMRKEVLNKIHASNLIFDKNYYKYIK